MGPKAKSKLKTIRFRIPSSLGEAAANDKEVDDDEDVDKDPAGYSEDNLRTAVQLLARAEREKEREQESKIRIPTIVVTQYEEGRGSRAPSFLDRYPHLLAGQQGQDDRSKNEEDEQEDLATPLFSSRQESVQ